MDLQTKEFMKTLTTEELADYADLEALWDKNWDIALEIENEEDRMRVVEKSLTDNMEPRFKNILVKLREHNSKLDLFKH
jgi:hypothetical protein